MPSASLPHREAILLPLYFLPDLDYFAALLPHTTLHLEACERLPRRTFRNRCHVLTANKVDTLTVPLVESRRAVPVREARIDYHQPWIQRHWGCLQAAYAGSPFYEYYADEFREIYARRPAYLFDFNSALLTLCLKLLDISVSITYTLSYQQEISAEVFDARDLVSSRKADKPPFFHQPIQYYQTFGNDFVTNLSIIDLLFNKGPEARQLLSLSAVRRV